MPPHVLVLGGGFGGLAAANALGRQGVRVTLVDRRNHHLFQPLLYQVATAGLAPSDIAEPIRSVLSRYDNVAVRLAEVAHIDVREKRVGLVSARSDASPDPTWVPYDKLVVALGMQTSWFGNDWESRAPGLKTLRDALEIRRRILLAFESAEWTDDPDERRRQLTFVVVGGGPTGVELAGAIAEIALSTFRRDFRNIDTREARVVLVEGASDVLNTYDPSLRAKAADQLRSLGVELKFGDFVESVDDHGVVVGGERIEAGTVLWAAGLEAPEVSRAIPGECDRAGRIRVASDCSLPGHPEVFVIGDLALMEQDGSPLPGVAPVAQGMGKHVARQILGDLQQREREPFVHRDMGQMATIGRRRAVLESGRIKMSGLFAWLAWVFVHLMVLVTVRNRVLVFVKWAWAWITYERASRLVWQTEPEAGEPSEG